MSLCTLIYILIYPIILFIDLLVKQSKAKTFLEDYVLHIRKPLALPFLNKTLYNSLREIHFNRTVTKYESKLFWINHFKQHKVKTPEVYGSIINEHYQGRWPLPKLDLIVKANRGCLGGGVYLVKQGEFGVSFQPSKLTDEYLVMRRVFNHRNLPKSNLSQHFRIISIKRPNNKVDIHDIIHYLDERTGEFKSNSGKGKYGLSLKELPFLKQAVNATKKLHKSLTPLFIAWDVIYTDKGAYFLEGNVVFGGLASYPSSLTGRKNYYKSLDRLYLLFNI